tara:strand:+ start:738 stop:1649 length:912 start_codon:yes stop_codon:yes gene_type:complete
MNQAEAAHSLVLELKRLRSEGVRDLYVEEESLAALEDSLRRNFGDPSSSSSTPGPTAPVSTAVSGNDRPKPKPSQVQSPPEDPSIHIPDPTPFSIPEGSKKERLDWLREKIVGCPTCNSELNPGGHVVFGTGNPEADLFLCGEAPGAEEEQQGVPFVGPAGELLNRILDAMNLPRDEVYIGNIMNWRPRHDQSFGNRPPTPKEMNFCMPYLKAQLEVVSPKVVVALGKTATDGLLGPDPTRRLGDVRGKWHEFQDIPMMVTYHPSYLLHNPSKASKRKVWEDMLLVMKRLELPISDKQMGFFR